MAGSNPLLSGDEVASFLRRIAREFKSNPLVNLNNLTYAGMVLASIGFVKGNNALKLLGDLLSDAPDKLRNLLSLRYTLMGTLGEVQSVVSRMTDEAINAIVEYLEQLASMFESEGINNDKLLNIIGALYDLIVIKLPTVTVAPEGE